MLNDLAQREGGNAALGAWQTELFIRLRALQVGGYHAPEGAATEPVALAALAILSCDDARLVHAADALAYLSRAQARDGSVGVRLDEAEPAWPTSLAVLAWEQAGKFTEDCKQWDGRIAPAVAWILNQRGKTSPRDPDIGHDPQLAAWSWAANTHSWIEPTALYVLALKAAGKTDHPRVREAVRMLIDRQLPTGGCNYGNTYVLGQMLRPHLEPSGILALALAGEKDESGRLDRTLAYLQSNLNRFTPPVSLAWALLGLAAHDRRPEQADEWLERAFERVCEKDESTYKLALLAHAWLASRSALVLLSRAPNS